MVNVNELVKDQMTSVDLIGQLFSQFEKELINNKDICLDFKDVNFISVPFLERLEKLVLRAKDLDARIKIVNLTPSIYKVFQVAKVKDVLQVCC